MRKIFLLLLFFTARHAFADDGYRLWLRYTPVRDVIALKQYKARITGLLFPANTPMLSAAREELVTGLHSMLGTAITVSNTRGSLMAGTPQSLPAISRLPIARELAGAGQEGFVIATVKFNGNDCTVIAANTDKGVLYGVFHFLRLLQTQQDISRLSAIDTPLVKYRILDHWDNLNRTVERGYAGFSIWDWHRLPGYLDPRYKDYARANASIGINGTVLNNVNANALILTPAYLGKAAALASVFRPYGIRVYLTARFSAPMEIGGLPTADPLDPRVKAWWQQKTDEVYRYIPDFGGFLVKANSEGQPGPQNYGRTHADGANMLADALEPHGGIVMWRAFVYDNNVPDDRAKQAYNEFKPLDGAFRKNVLVQVKNGPIDFQPREPFHPLFGAMPQTPLMMEFQVTQEYLGFATHLVYLAPLYKECLDADTYTNGKGSLVAKTLQGMAGVANIGTDINWCGHPFAAANWYAFGRLAWNSALTAADIANEWLRMTFSNDTAFVHPVTRMMLASREAAVNYMTPLGLHHLMGYSHHYGPGPWVANKQRADWTSVYYHKADSAGIGFDRTATGSHALEQYAAPVRAIYEQAADCPESYLLWFHHLPWGYRMKDGSTLWQALVRHYYRGAAAVDTMALAWAQQEGRIDAERFEQVKELLAIQQQEARWWRNACVLYFQSFSRLPLPEGCTPPDKTLEYYKSLEFHFVPGI